MGFRERSPGLFLFIRLAAGNYRLREIRARFCQDCVRKGQSPHSPHDNFPYRPFPGPDCFFPSLPHTKNPSIVSKRASTTGILTARIDSFPKISIWVPMEP